MLVCSPEMGLLRVLVVQCPGLSWDYWGYLLSGREIFGYLFKVNKTFLLFNKGKLKKKKKKEERSKSWTYKVWLVTDTL